MDHLPDLAILEIISNFNLNEQFKLRSINKRWKSLIELSAKNRKSLFVYDIIYSNQERWTSDYEKVDSREIINLNFFKYFCLEKNYFPNIIKLFLYNLIPDKFETNELKSRLKEITINLKELSIEIINAHIEYFGQDLIFKIIDIENLILPNLKVFSIKELYIEQENFKVNAPNLEKLTIDFIGASNERIILSNPQSIKELECQDFSIINRVNNFNNLEYLFCTDISSNFILSDFPKLKKLEIYPQATAVIIRNETFLKNLFKQKLKLEILIFGFKFEKIDDNLRELLRIFNNDGIMDHLSISFDRFNKIKDRLNFGTKCFKRSFEIFDYKVQPLVDSFYLSKINIQRITTFDPKNFKNLTEFLIRIGGIKELHIYRCILNDDTIANLKSVPFIYFLYISTTEMNKNFDFIGEIKYLNYFEFYKRGELQIELINNFISSIKKFNIDRYSFDNYYYNFFNCHNGITRIIHFYSKRNPLKQLKNLDELYFEINN